MDKWINQESDHNGNIQETRPLINTSLLIVIGYWWFRGVFSGQLLMGIRIQSRYYLERLEYDTPLQFKHCTVVIPRTGCNRQVIELGSTYICTLLWSGSFLELRHFKCPFCEALCTLFLNYSIKANVLSAIYCTTNDMITRRDRTGRGRDTIHFE